MSLFFEKIDQLIAQDKLQEAFEELSNYLNLHQLEEQNRQLILLSARYHRLLKDRQAGIIYDNSFQVDYARIIIGLNDLVQKLKLLSA